MSLSRRSLLMGAAGAAAAASLPAFTKQAHAVGNSHGLEVIANSMITDRLQYLRFRTKEIAWGDGGPAVNVLLPHGYHNSNRRYPVLYLLHGGDRDFRFFHQTMHVENMNTGNMIVVMPDGGRAGWYSNPVASAVGARNWETFHMSQLVPWIDAHFRTRAEFAGRAVAGFSMGGFGALKYTHKYYGHFSAVTSFSGPADIRGFGQAVVRWANLSSTVDLRVPGGLYGVPWDQKRVSMDNAMENIERYRGKRVAFYSGTHPDPQESNVVNGHINFDKALTAAGIPHHFQPFPGVHTIRWEDLNWEIDRIAEHFGV